MNVWAVLPEATRPSTFTAAGALVMLGEPARSYHVIGGAIVLADIAIAQ